MILMKSSNKTLKKAEKIRVIVLSIQIFTK